MHYITRLATCPERVSFPLPLDGPIQWHRHSEVGPGEGSSWRACVSIKGVPGQHIIVPSYTCLSPGYQYQWTAGDASTDEQSILSPVLPANTGPWQSFNAGGTQTEALVPKIDCWHSAVHVDELMLHLSLFLPESQEPPTWDLMTVSVRPVDLDIQQLPTPCEAVRTPRPAPVSQMQAEKTIARRICSPTATAMAVMGSAAATHWPQAVEHCYDPLTKAYGKWPLATYWASEHGLLGSVEAFVDWGNALTALKTGQPIVCSIRYAKDQLPGAPQPQSGGHLLVLYGVEFDQDQGFALVMDPASATPDQVSRRYPLKAFTEAWLAHRGGAYVFASAPAGQQHANTNAEDGGAYGH